MIRFIKLFTVIFSLLGVSYAYAADNISTGRFSNLAVSGYDTVSYFTKGQPVKGHKDISTQWNGAEWRFSSQDNLDLFIANPDKYAPQYGGYCAWAAAENSLAPSDPKQWHIENGKLYLNYNKKIKERWLPNRTEFISQADKNFPSLVK